MREPTNPHDKRAVRIDWRGRKLGYLPRVENAAVEQMPDRGERIEARIAELRVSPDPWERAVLAVELTIWSEEGMQFNGFFMRATPLGRVAFKYQRLASPGLADLGARHIVSKRTACGYTGTRSPPLGVTLKAEGRLGAWCRVRNQPPIHEGETRCR